MTSQDIKHTIIERYAHQPHYVQAVEEFIDSVSEYIDTHFTDAQYRILDRLLVPERVISFRVDWMNDAGIMQHNQGYRVQFNSALGPYKGGLRFAEHVNEDVLKFLGFEQIFKNALTGLQLGGAKGGSDFSSKGRSDREIREFCRAFMLQLREHVGLEKDVPAGDIGVGAREIGYLFGAFKRISNTNEGVLTGKDELFGGSCQRTEATGHGVVYFAEAVARTHSRSLSGMRAVVSGAGNVAEHTARKLIDSGVTVVTLSDRSGYVYKESGLSHVDISQIIECKESGQPIIDMDIEGVAVSSGSVWQEVEVEAYFPCATQNEIMLPDAKAIVAQGVLLIEGANMPLTAEAAECIMQSDVLYGPGKAANAGGVTVSGIEMAQNAGHYAWTCEQVEAELKRIMEHIHAQCLTYGTKDGATNYVRGANIAGLRRVLDAMQKLGW